MGQTNGTERQVIRDLSHVADRWIQFALLLLALITFALHGESRLSKIEQRMDDAEANRAQMQQQLERVEQLLLSRTP